MAASNNNISRLLSDVTHGLPAWQSDLIEQVLSSLGEYYCLPDKFESMKSTLAIGLVNKCKEINATQSDSDSPPSSDDNYRDFAKQMNVVLHHFDPHLEFEYNPRFIKDMEEKKKIQFGAQAGTFDFSDGPPREEVEKWNKYEQDNPSTRNYGFIDYQGTDGAIPDNIGYVNISHLIDPRLGADQIEEKYRMGPAAIKRLHEVMTELREKDGIILDLNATPYGGSPEMVQNVVSFFMPDGTPINTVHDRVTGEHKNYEAIHTPFKILNKPVALLVGSNTFSGREETAYDLQQYNKTLPESRFTVIGQRTKGGAHPEYSFPLISPSSGKVNNALVLRIPYATSINPVSGTNWEDGPAIEGKKPGIYPDIEVPEDKSALKAAVEHLEALISKPADVMELQITQQYRRLASDLRDSTHEPDTPASITPLRTTPKQ